MDDTRGTWNDMCFLLKDSLNGQVHRGRLKSISDFHFMGGSDNVHRGMQDDGVRPVFEPLIF